MKQWKLVLVALLSVLLVCACTSALAEEGTKCTKCTPHSVVTKAATCTETGLYDIYMCNVKTCPNSAVILQKDVVSEKLAHTFAGRAEKAATCEEAGHTYYQICTVCGELKGWKEVPALGHDKVLNEHTKAPTCSATGIDTYGCKNGCGETWEVEVAIVADAHSFKWRAEKAATCEEAGYVAHQYCTLCGELKGFKEIAALGHDKVLNEHTKAPTCTATGIDTYGCMNGCGETWEVEVPMIDHHIRTIAEVKALCEADGCTAYKACWNCDWTEGKEVIPALGHDWEHKGHFDATCTEEGYDLYNCKNGCKYGTTYHVDNIVPKLPHSYTIKGGAEAPTCTEEGYQQWACDVCGDASKIDKIPATGHNFSVKYATVPADCENEGYTEYACANNCGNTEKRDFTPALGHDYSKTSCLISNTAPTCTAEGVKTYKCDRCTKTIDEKVAKLPHNHPDFKWTTVVPATCVAGGTEKNDCTICGGDTLYRTTEALGHKMSKVQAYAGKAPTCTEAGEGFQTCENEYCGLVVSVPMDPIGHTWKQRSHKDPECEVDGYTGYVCVNDSTHTKVETIPATGHQNFFNDIVVPATCTGNGLQHVWCDDCKTLIKGNDIIPATGHGPWEVGKTVDPDCVTPGSVEKTCKVCGVKVVETIPALGHNYVWETVTKPTASAAGVDAKICTRCGDVAETKNVKYTNEKYNATLTVYGPSSKELGGKEWNRVAPIDLSVDATYTLPLVASNQYVVGTVTIVVANGTLTVTYDTNSWQIKVDSESLVIFASKADLVAGIGTSFPVGTAINIAEAFGADTKVIVALELSADFDAAGVGVYGLNVDADEIATMLVNVD